MPAESREPGVLLFGLTILYVLIRPEAVMFYEPKDGSGLPHNPLNAIVVPRPIGWISTLSAEGVPNLAPYSFFNAVAYTPPQVMFAATSNHQFGGLKDAVIDAQTTGEFVVNVATWEMRDTVSVPYTTPTYGSAQMC